MPLKSVPLALAGMNNRASDTGLPVDKYRNAVNVDFNDSNQLEFPRIGSTQVYSGTDCHSWFEYIHDYGLGLLIEGTNLKLLKSDFTVTTLRTVGSQAMCYATLNDSIYYSNGTVFGRYKDGAVHEWGVDASPIQPTATATPSGGMYAGDYQVAITWLMGSGEHFEESGTGNATRVTVEDGGGIRLTDFPVPPATVNGVAIYVTAVNSKELYLYDEYPVNVSEVFIQYHIGTVPLTTQFGIRVQPKLGLTVYNGGIFWIDGNLVRYTDPHWLGLQRPYNFMDFEHEVLSIVGIQTGPFYAITTKGIYRVDGIYGEVSKPTRIKTYGGAKAALYDDNDNIGYFMTDNGFVSLSFEGASELHADHVATPLFESGSMAIVEHNGARRLIGVFKNGTVNRLQHPDYTSGEVARGSTGL